MIIRISVEQEADVAGFGSRAVADALIRLVTEAVASGDTVVFENQPVNTAPTMAYTISNENELEKWRDALLGRLRDR